MVVATSLAVRARRVASGRGGARRVDENRASHGGLYLPGMAGRVMGAWTCNPPASGIQTASLSFEGTQSSSAPGARALAAGRTSPCRNWATRSS